MVVLPTLDVYRIHHIKASKKNRTTSGIVIHKKVMLPQGNDGIAQQKTFHMGIGALFKYVWNINK